MMTIEVINSDDWGSALVSAHDAGLRGETALDQVKLVDQFLLVGEVTVVATGEAE